MAAVYALLSINAAVFGAWQYAIYTKDGRLLKLLEENAMQSHDAIMSGRYWTMLTAAFSQREPAHFAFNMIALHAFGSILSFVPGVGAAHVLALGFGSAIGASIGWLYHTRRSSSGKIFRPALGASGMVMGMGAAATLLAPFSPMTFGIPLWVAMCGYVVYDTYYLDKKSNIGHAAHLAGFSSGVVYYLAYLRNRGGVWLMLKRGLLRR